jgi:hypothetical protein
VRGNVEHDLTACHGLSKRQLFIEAAFDRCGAQRPDLGLTLGTSGERADVPSTPQEMRDQAAAGEAGAPCYKCGFHAGISYIAMLYSSYSDAIEIGKPFFER